MQLQHIAFSLFAAVATAQNSTSLAALVSELPTCAVDCFESASTTAGCAPTNFTCLCGNAKTAFLNAIEPCILGAGCSLTDLTKLASLPTEICNAVNDNPSSADVASASAIVTSALGAEATHSSTNAAAMPQITMGVMGAAALAAFAL